MYFARQIDAVLAEWSAADDRKPLILRGARQTGKASSVRQLGSRYELFLELNLERYQDLALVRAGRELGVRLHAGAFADQRHEVRMPEGPLRCRLVSLPLYLAEEVPGWLAGMGGAGQEEGEVVAQGAGRE